MGTLTDITAKANNAIKRQSSEIIASQAPESPASIQHLGKSKSPRFMSPTVSSSKQSVTAAKNAYDRTLTSSSPTSGKGDGWMASAAKRVGISRTSDGTPRSRKEGLLKHPKTPSALTFPDKLPTPSYSQLPDSPSPSLSQAPDTKLGDKPLPSPPIARVIKASPIKEARSLIDASEKPLRRSPPGMPYHEEEWPVLFPEKPTTPETLRQMTQQDNTGGSPKSTYHQPERYPILPTTTYHPMSEPEKPMGKASSMQKLQRKEVPRSTSISQNPENLRLDLDQKGEKYDASPNIYVEHAASGTQLPDRSAGAAAIEKSAEELKSINQPRQTRTSSLRARLSAGQLINDPTGKSKTMGFTDFTNVKEPLARGGEGELRGFEGFHNRSSSPSNAHTHAMKSSRESLRGNRPPAQFVAGSRRSSHRRPSSRGSLQTESRASSPSVAPQPPTHSAPGPPDATQVLPTPAMTNSEKSKAIERRRSSIPVFRSTISNPVVHTKAEHTLELMEKALAQPKKASADEIKIFEDKSGHHPKALRAIKESPRQNYETKRLSIASPEHGPTLRISPSADRLIMGTGSDKENQPKFSKYRSKDTKGADLASGLKRAKDKQSSASLQTPAQRPSSSQGLPLSASRRSLVNIESREKKAESTDVSFLMPNDHVKDHSMITTASNSRKNTGSSGDDDPFFDATDCLQDSMAGAGALATNKTQKCDGKDVKVVEDESWISPMQKPQSATEFRDAIPVNSDYLPFSLQKHLGKGVEHDYQHQIGKMRGQTIGVSGGHLESSNNTKLMSGLPATPDQAGHITGGFSSGSFPPRSSSHAAHPDYTIDGSATASVSPLSPLGRTSKVSLNSLRASGVDSAITTKSIIRQKNHDSLQRLASAQVDTSSLALKRDSTARESNKKQVSVSKGVLSNLRGLFNKRSSANSEPSSMRSNKKAQQVRINSAGSPFPPISEVHPVYRPTLASINRAKATIVANNAVNNAPLTPSFASPIPSEVSKTTTLAMQILDSARTERSTPKQRRLLELGTIMVDAVTQARDAEKAMEEAKQAARKAEVAYVMCRKSLGDVTSCVEEWRDEMSMM